MAATALLVGEASELPPGQPLQHQRPPHRVQAVLEIKDIRGSGGGVGGGLSEHQALLLDSPELTLKVSRTPCPASPLPTNRETYVTHHCIEVIEQYILAGLTYQTVDLYPALKQNGCRMAAVPCTMASERWGCHCQPSGSNRGKTGSPGTH